MVRIARHAVEHPRTWLVALLAISVALGLSIRNLEVRTDGAAIYPVGNRVIDQCARDHERFDDAEQIILLAGAREEGHRIDTPTGLRWIRRLSEELGGLAYVDARRTISLASRQDVSFAANTLRVHTPLDSIPDDSTSFADFLADLGSRPFVGGVLLSPDGRYAAAYVALDPQFDRIDALAGLRKWIDAHGDGDFNVQLLGPAVAESGLGDTVLRDLKWLIPVLLVVVAALLWASLRSVAGVVIPLVEAAFVLIWVFGLMSVCAVPVTLATTILPIILLAVAITDEIHLLERVQVHLSGDRRNGARTQRNGEAILCAVRDVERPIVWSSITTSIGMLAFVSANVIPIKHFGVFAALGILFAMLFSFTLIPALAMVLPRSWLRRTRSTGQMAAVGPRDAAGPARLWMILTVVGAVAAGAAGIGRIQVQDAWIDNFAPDSPLVRADRLYNEGFWGSYLLDLVLEGKPGFFESARGAALLDRLSTSVDSLEHVGGVLTHAKPLRRLIREMGHGESLSSLSDEEIAEASLVLSLVVREHDMRQYVLPDYSAARVRIAVKSPNYQRAVALEDAISALMPRVLKDLPVTFHLSGELRMAREAVGAVVANQLRSLAGTIIGIALLLLLVYPRGLAGIALIVPVMAAAIILFGAMGYAGIPLGIATSMFAGMMVAIGVDFAVFLHHAYRRARRAGLAHTAALLEADASAGRAIRWNAIVLAMGFATLLVSSLPPNRYLGLLLSIAIIACLLTTRVLLPPLLKRIAVGLLLLVAGSQSVATAGDLGAASGVMQSLDHRYRSQPRAVRLDITTHFVDRNLTVERTIWGVINGDTLKSKFLYVVTQPVNFRGTTLLFHDVAGDSTGDGIWLGLPAFHTFYSVMGSLQAATLAGTALSYEDARGFISGEWYSYSFCDSVAPDLAAGSCCIVAAPRSEGIRHRIGYSGLRIVVDTAAGTISHIDFRNRFGRLFKTYDVAESVTHGGASFPTRAKVELTEVHIRSEVRYAYVWIEDAPLELVFRADTSGTDFLSRLLNVLGTAGIDSARALSPADAY